MKNFLLLFVISLCPIILFSQKLDVEGQAKISVMNSDPTAQYVVVRQADGILAVRDVSSLADADSDPANEIQDLSLSGNILTITNNGTATDIDLSAFLDNTDTQLTETEVDAFVGNNGYLTTEIDGSTTNEIQDLNLSGNILTITNNGTATDIDLSAFLDNTDTQLTETEVDAFVGNNGYLTTEIDGSTTNEIQALTISNDTIFLENGGFVDLNTNKHYVGELWGGGVVYYTYNNGLNGLIVSPDDLATPSGLYWEPSPYTLIGSDNYGDGSVNTSMIVGALGVGNYPAYLCDTLSINGFNDWYLPAKSELLLLQNAFFVIESIYDYDSDPNTNSLIESDTGNGYAGYWSSTEGGQYQAEHINFNKNDQGDDKYRQYRVRAIRRF